MTRQAVTPPRSVRLTMAAAQRLGMSARLVDPASGYLLEIQRGRDIRRVLGSLTGLNSAVAARISQDKLYTEIILRQAGFNTPESVGCIRPGHYQDPTYVARIGLVLGLDFAAQRGYPVIVKPNRMALGHHVTLAHDPDELESAVRAVWEDDYMALVQTVACGRDLRINLLDGDALVAYWRHAITITGDGKHTVRQLMIDTDSRYADDDHFARCIATPTWKRCVTSRALAPPSILPRDATVDFGGVALDVRHFATFRLVDHVPPIWLEWCTDIARTLELRYLGIDLEVPAPHDTFDLDLLSPETSTILETNAAPTMNRLCQLGHTERAVEAQMRVVEALFD